MFPLAFLNGFINYVNFLKILLQTSKFFGDYKSANFAFRFLSSKYPKIDVEAEIEWIASLYKRVATQQSVDPPCIVEANSTSTSADFSLDALKRGSNSKRKVLCEVICLLVAEYGTNL